MKIKLIEQVIDVPDDVGAVMIRDQEITPDDHIRQTIKTAKGWSFDVEFPLVYEQVGE